MKVLFYANNGNGAAKRLQTVIESVAAKEDVIRCKELSSLPQSVCRLGSDIGIAVLMAADMKELKTMASMRNLLQRVRVIVVVPDRREETITKGHELFPRFLSYGDGDFKDVGAVLEKMLTSSRQAKKREVNYEKCA